MRDDKDTKQQQQQQTTEQKNTQNRDKDAKDTTIRINNRSQTEIEVMYNVPAAL